MTLKITLGLLRVQGKGKKERALFVTGKLFSNLVGYLQHTQTPKQKTSPMFPIQLKQSHFH